MPCYVTTINFTLWKENSFPKEKELECLFILNGRFYIHLKFVKFSIVVCWIRHGYHQLGAITKYKYLSCWLQVFFLRKCFTKGPVLCFKLQLNPVI